MNVLIELAAVTLVYIIFSRNNLTPKSIYVFNPAVYSEVLLYTIVAAALQTIMFLPDIYLGIMAMFIIIMRKAVMAEKKPAELIFYILIMISAAGTIVAGNSGHAILAVPVCFAVFIILSSLLFRDIFRDSSNPLLSYSFMLAMLSVIKSLFLSDIGNAYMKTTFLFLIAIIYNMNREKYSGHYMKNDKYFDYCILIYAAVLIQIFVTVAIVNRPI